MLFWPAAAAGRKQFERLASVRNVREERA